MWSNRLPAINCGHFYEVVKGISSLFILLDIGDLFCNLFVSAAESPKRLN